MANFRLNNISAIGGAQIKEGGSIIQQCMLEIAIDGIALQDKKLSDIVSFEVPNAEMVGKPQPIVAAWDYIKNVLAPEWVAENYANA